MNPTQQQKVQQQQQKQPTHYHIVHDQEQLNQFAQMILPKHEGDAILLNLLARRKYAPELLENVYMLTRVPIVGTEEKEIEKNGGAARFVRHVLRLGGPVGCYVYTNSEGEEVPVPTNALAVYCHINPRSTVTALLDSAHEVNQMLAREFLQQSRQCQERGEEENDVEEEKKSNAVNVDKNRKIRKRFVPNTLKMMQRMLVKSTSTERPWLHLDIDCKESWFVDELRQVLRQANALAQPHFCVETCNGFHFMFKKAKGIDYRALHDFGKLHGEQKLSRDGKSFVNPYLSIMHDPLIVVPGTMQGDWPVRFSEIFDMEETKANLEQGEQAQQ